MTTGQRILIIEDNNATRKLLEAALHPRGYVLQSVASGEEGLRALFALRPQLVLLDVSLPGIDGFETCRRILQVIEIPIIFLTAMDTEEDMMRGLEAGAVDFIVKPFGIKVLIAKISAILRLSAQVPTNAPAAIYDDGYLMIDLNSRKVTVQGKRVHLTATEYNLLAYMSGHAGQVMTFRQILEHVWGWEYQESTNYVYTYIRHLRRKLEAEPMAPRYLIAEHGVGYRFKRNA